MLVVAIVLLIAVGPEQLPGVIRKVGQMVSQFRGMTEGIRAEFMSGLDEIERAADPREWAKDEPSSNPEATKVDDLDDRSDSGEPADEAGVTDDFDDLGDEADDFADDVDDLGDEAEGTDDLADDFDDLGDEAEGTDDFDDLGDEAEGTDDLADDFDDLGDEVDPPDLDDGRPQISGNGASPSVDETLDSGPAGPADEALREEDQAGSAGGGDSGQ